jgi:hypothetical protein
MKTIFTLFLLALCGCASVKDHVLVGTSTVLGFEVAQNPATEMYQARLGYARAEIALVPTNSVNVLTEMRFNNLFSFSGGGIYQRMAIGDIAVKQSVFMFAKDSTGTLSLPAADAISKAAPYLGLTPTIGVSMPTNSIPK